jgi:hypothetical protein
VFVHLETHGESPIRIERGNVISFAGVLRALPSDAAVLGVSRADGAPLLARQHAYIAVRLSHLTRVNQD